MIRCSIHLCLLCLSWVTLGTILILVKPSPAVGLVQSSAGAAVGRIASVLAGGELSLAQPLFEDRLGGGATNILRGIRIGIRKVAKTIFAAMRRWRQWMPSTLFFATIALLAPLLDWSLVRSWRDSGPAAARNALIVGLAIYIRLLLDRRAPVLGKILLGFALVYGAATRDLVPDSMVPIGFAEDITFVVVAARCFLRLCPDGLVAHHAVRATHGRVAATGG